MSSEMEPYHWPAVKDLPEEAQQVMLRVAVRRKQLGVTWTG